jgi:hypothetical protein
MKLSKYLTSCTLVTATILNVGMESAEARRAQIYGSSGTGSSSIVKSYQTIIDGQPTGIVTSVPNNNSSEVSFTIFDNGITDLLLEEQNVGFFPGAIQSYVGTKTTSRDEPVIIDNCFVSPEFGGNGEPESCILTENGSVVFDIITTTETLFSYENLDLLATVIESQVFYDPVCSFYSGFSCPIGSFPGVKYEFKSMDEVIATFEIPYPNDFNPDFGFPEFQSFEAINDLSVISKNFFGQLGISIPGIRVSGDSKSLNSFSSQIDIPDANSQSVPESNSIFSILAVGILSYRLRNKPKKR